METETRQKIEDMVMEILKNSNIEETTEFSIRVAASERLGIDLSYPERKQLVRTVIESFLLAVAAEDGGVLKPPEPSAAEEPRASPAVALKPKKEVKDDSDRVICQLSNKRNVVVKDFKGTTLVSIREFYLKDGKQLPTAKGISLPAEQWSIFRKNVPAIEEAITKMEGKLRSEPHGTQNGGDVMNSFDDVAPLDLTPIEISRFDGKNYQLWTQQMDFILKQLKIDYVLTEQCPNTKLREDASTEEIAAAKAAERRWVNDDLMCRRNILSHLSDHLFNQYAHRKMSAKKLLEELKMIYLYEEFGTKRSQVKKYIEFQMGDEKTIFEQIQEFNSITDSIVAAGMLIDESFHVSVIISKLPPSWKDFCFKLMHEEYLPLCKLMEYIRVEEDSRNGVKRFGEPSNGIGFHHHQANIRGPWGNDSNPPSVMHRNKSEYNGRSITCYVCGKKGHLSKHCRRRFDKQANGRREENVCTPTEVNMPGGLLSNFTAS